MQATEGYSESHLSGSVGSVYRGTLNNGRDVAVKVFNLQHQNAFKSFDVECDVLRSLRHRNLCKVISTCFSPDFKALVLEYMSNGSLENMKPSSENFSGELSQRSWINDSMPNAITQIIDSNLLVPEEEYYTEKLKCLSSIMELALNCSMESANEKMNMKEEVVALKKIRYEILAYYPNTKGQP
ncbi:unnamed protein product [Fraxinus pennsylvanica]|uniref:Protein kinase domain-containing protein n=1 Tax=Fraxinus pennsylvanica TaxID=56036 RepID=A0AAD2ECD3_9LAMI|nr:unnamed protein product [Fraxinus pennsylvanica]